MKIGDRVRRDVGAGYNEGLHEGDEGVVVSFEGDGVNVLADKGGKIGWHYKKYLAVVVDATGRRRAYAFSKLSPPKSGDVVRLGAHGQFTVKSVNSNGEITFTDRPQSWQLWQSTSMSNCTLVSATSAAKPAIVCLIENGRPKPATRPYVHADRTSANKEANRLAGIHKGQEFGVYEFVSTAKHERVYDHQWQNTAKAGLKIEAIKQLRSVAGLPLATAKTAVEDWLTREAA